MKPSEITEKLVVDMAHQESHPLWDECSKDKAIFDEVKDLVEEVIRRTETILGTIRSNRLIFQQECFARGVEGKAEWFRTVPEYEVAKRKARGFWNVFKLAAKDLKELSSKHWEKNNWKERALAAEKRVYELEDELKAAPKFRS